MSITSPTVTAPTNSSQSPFHNLANISYTGILSRDLGVHIGVYQP